MVGGMNWKSSNCRLEKQGTARHPQGTKFKRETRTFSRIFKHLAILYPLKETKFRNFLLSALVPTAFDLVSPYFGMGYDRIGGEFSRGSQAGWC